MSRRLVVVTAGVSQPSSTRLLADQIADATRAAVSARGEDLVVDVIELREIAVALAASVVTGGLPSPEVAAAKALVADADGLVAVTPVFAASYSGLFKLFVDVLDPDALNGLPVVIAATAGTARHSLVLDHALRPLFSHLRAVVVPTGVFAATEDFGGDADGTPLPERISRAAGELAALMVATPSAVGGFTPEPAGRARHSGLTVSSAVTPFAELLRGHSG